VKLADTLRAAWNEPELRQRILFIFAIFGVYVIALNITLPIQGVKPEAITAYLEQQVGGYLGLLNMFGGGAIGKISIIALGLNPYITSSIIMQLMSVAIPSLKQEKQEGGQFARQKERVCLRSYFAFFNRGVSSNCSARAFRNSRSWITARSF
jgi:preprotein translocase subunit SecY